MATIREILGSDKGMAFLEKNDLSGFYEFAANNTGEYGVPKITQFFEKECGIDTVEGLLASGNAIPMCYCYGGKNYCNIPDKLLKGKVLTIPDGFDIIKRGAFYNRTDVDHLILDYVEVLEPECFAYNEFDSVKFGDKLTSNLIRYPLMALGAFQDSGISTLIFPRAFKDREQELYESIFEFAEAEDLRYY